MRPHIKKRRSIMRSLATVAAATVAAVTILPVATATATDVRFEYLNATNTVLEYVISFDGVPEENDFRIVVETPNGCTVSEQAVEEEIVSGTVEELTPGYRYEISVMDGNVTIESRTVTMAIVKRTALDGVEHECKCALDGTFHFRLVGFSDENGYLDGFYATLTDEYGNSSRCDFADSPTEEHTLAVNDVGMRGNRAFLRIACTTTEPDENGDRTAREYVLYESEVAI